jgi:hypothetical protein
VQIIIYQYRDSVVGIATGYGLDDREVGDRVLVGSRIFILHVTQTGSGVHLTDPRLGPNLSYPKITGGYFLGG